MVGSDFDAVTAALLVNPERSLPVEVGALCEVVRGGQQGVKGAVKTAFQLDEDHRVVTLATEQGEIMVPQTDLRVLAAAASQNGPAPAP